MSNLVVDVIEDDREDYYKKVGGQWATLPDSSALLPVCGVAKSVFDSELRAGIERLYDTYDLVGDSYSFQGVKEHCLIDSVEGFFPV